LNELMGRKTFMDWLVGLGAAGVAFVMAFPLVKFVNPPARSSESGEWVDAGKASDIKSSGSVSIMSSAGLPLIVFGHGDDEFTALEKKCPHLGCMVELLDGELVCPCHGAKFSLDGELLGGPAPRGLKRFDVQMRPDGHVFVGKEMA
jgi:cytochrome b6-f complex iron-sulfur subunit